MPSDANRPDNLTLATPNRWWPAAILLGLVVISYWPVIQSGGFIWDDPQHVVKNTDLRDLPGLARIWIDPTSIPQYYPLVHTTFWIEFHLWGLSPRGYHIDNIALHALAAILLWRLLLRLKIPAAFLAAAIFAVHPMQVESVAWITERKNVLSTVFYLLAIHAYLNFAGEDLDRDSSRWGMYALSLLLFVAALLSKSVACSLPAAILLLVYWKHDGIGWRDVLPLLPFFVIGFISADLTATLERTHVGASGPEWDFSLIDRFLIAGRAVWFYVAKFLWPHPLSFVYPRWEGMNLSARPMMILFPIAVAAAILVLWLLRKEIGRGPLVAALFFIGTLMPALGFVNVFPMRYTFVADHYVYVACIGLIVLVAAILNRLLGRAAMVIVIPLVALSFSRGWVYRDSLTLWWDTEKHNPNSWMVWGNLGDEYADRNDRPDARRCYAKLLELAPNEGVAHWKWGIVLEYDNNLNGAEDEFAKAIRLDPNAVPVRNSLGLLYIEENNLPAAMECFLDALSIDPQNAEAHFNYGVVLEKQGNFPSAQYEYLMAVKFNPGLADAQYNLANAQCFHFHRPDMSLEHYAAAIAANPDRYDYHFNYGQALRLLGKTDEARQQYQTALRLNPDFAPAKQMLDELGD
ncbi:MAG: tetratricopeptide repeat protein [Tepidisphaeraceae bacterium]|jgi:tetratricopeptide (TPR) repeat protein